MVGRMKTFLKIAAALVALYLAITAGFYLVMSQTPEKIAKTMMYVPWAAFRVFPLRTVWMNARNGNLKQGEMAPDFLLETTDHKTRFALASLRGQKPVVLVFGSYT